MGTPPTFVAEFEGPDWTNNASPKFASSVTTAFADVLAIFGMSEDWQSTISTPAGGGLTYTLEQSVVVSGYAANYLYSAVEPAGQTFNLTCSGGGITLSYGINALQFRDSSGLGASAKVNATGAPSLSITTVSDNSAVVVAVADWNAVDGASRTWRTGAGAFTEKSYFNYAAHYTIYGGYHADAGPAGTYTVGLSAPAGQKYSVTALEVMGVSAQSPNLLIDTMRAIRTAGTVLASNNY